MLSPFERSNSPARVAFVSDFWPEELVGGAELTLAALADEVSLTLPISKHRARDLTPALVDSADPDCVWVLGNCVTANPAILQQIASSWRYVVVEFDYKLCVHRSLEKHFAVAGKRCDCASTQHGRFVQRLFDSAEMVLWMSEAQRVAWTSVCPLPTTKHDVVGSLFSEVELSELRQRALSRAPTDAWAVLASDSWVKGTQASLDAAQSSGKRVKLLQKLEPSQLLRELASCAGLVYRPAGADTCPRLVIEAAALGLELDCNSNVQHLSEGWASLRGEALLERLALSRRRAAHLITDVFAAKRTISGYVTTLNCVSSSYPVEACVSSMLGFCDEVVVLDGGSTDGTLELLRDRFGTDARVRLEHHAVDLSAADFALEDGRQKARARRLCKSQLCWQQDADEIVDKRDFDAVKRLANAMRRGAPALSLPVVEFWGGAGAESHARPVRIDVTPWKWRLSLNTPNVTHGVPRGCASTDAAGRVTVVGSDGCDLIDALTGDPVQHACFHTAAHEALRTRALSGDAGALKDYEAHVNAVCSRLPVVWHYSWFDLRRKIELYQRYWTKHWSSLAGRETENHMFPGIDPSEVTPEMMTELARQLSGAGGWIWHQPWDGAAKPTISVRRRAPL